MPLMLRGRSYHLLCVLDRALPEAHKRHLHIRLAAAEPNLSYEDIAQANWIGSIIFAFLRRLNKRKRLWRIGGCRCLDSEFPFAFLIHLSSGLFAP